jgi:hypothetical protein
MIATKRPSRRSGNSPGEGYWFIVFLVWFERPFKLWIIRARLAHVTTSSVFIYAHKTNTSACDAKNISKTRVTLTSQEIQRKTKQATSNASSSQTERVKVFDTKSSHK